MVLMGRFRRALLALAVMLASIETQLSMTRGVLGSASGVSEPEVPAQAFVDIVIPVASKDATVLRFTLRHAIHFAGDSVRNLFVVCRPTSQMQSIAQQTNDVWGAETVPAKLTIVDEAKFPFSVESIRSFLRTHRPTEGFDGQPFDGKVVVPEVCRDGSPKGKTKNWVYRCRQPTKNETATGRIGAISVQSFDRAGWLFQQFIKLGIDETVSSFDILGMAGVKGVASHQHPKIKRQHLEIWRMLSTFSLHC